MLKIGVLRYCACRYNLSLPTHQQSRSTRQVVLFVLFIHDNNGIGPIYIRYLVSSNTLVVSFESVFSNSTTFSRPDRSGSDHRNIAHHLLGDNDKLSREILGGFGGCEVFACFFHDWTLTVYRTFEGSRKRVLHLAKKFLSPIIPISLCLNCSDR